MPPTFAGRHPVDERRGQLGEDGRHQRQPLRHTARHADAGGDVRDARQHDAAGEPAPVGRADRLDAVVDVGELRQQEVEGPGERGDHQERARSHPDESFERLRLDTGCLADLVAYGFEQRLRCLPAGRRGQRQGLDERRGGGQVGGREGPGRGRGGGLRPGERWPVRRRARRGRTPATAAPLPPRHCRSRR